MSNQRITYLLEAWTSRKSTPAEERELFDWITDNSDQSPIHAHVQQLVEQYNTNDLVPAVEWENLYERILESRQIDQGQPQISRIHLLRRSWFRYAAAVLLLIGIAAIAVVVFSDRQLNIAGTDVAESANNDALPGRDRAILTLANGKTILLDSMQGNIVQQGDFTVVNQNGKLDYEGKDNTVQYHTLSIPNGGQYKLQLPDGTDVWLNAASSITYPTAFVGKDRYVTITGEAYFEVAKDKSKPFHVKVNDMEVEVLGTHFNINSYSEEDAVKTTLLEGSVKVIKANDMAMLKPGQQAQYAGRISVINDADLDQVMAWKNGSFLFDGTPLTAVMRQLSRWYDVDVVYEKGVPDINLGGEMKRDLNLSQVLKGLGKMGVNFRIEGKKLVVLP